MRINTYFKPIIHQNNPEILGINTIRTIGYKILQLKVEKSLSFLSLSYMQINSYLGPNIHQNGPGILGINCRRKGLLFHT
jgi:hypothetical protein